MCRFRSCKKLFYLADFGRFPCGLYAKFTQEWGPRTGFVQPVCMNLHLLMIVLDLSFGRGGVGDGGRQSAGAAGALAGPLDGGVRGAGGRLSFCDRLHGRSVPCGSALLPLRWAGLTGRARKEPPCPYCHPVGALLAWLRLGPAPQPACAGLSSDGGRWARVAHLRGCRQGRVGNLFGWCRKGGGFEGVDARG